MNKNISIASIIIFFGISALGFVKKSPSHPGTDSSVFQTVAMMIENGYMPYKDIFDHKGPLIYLLDWLGRSINDFWGVCFIQWCFMLFTMILLFKITSFATKKIAIRLLSVFIVLLYLKGLYGRGNMTEEFALPLIATSLLLFLEYILEEKKSWWRYVLCGACFASVLLLRPNMIAVWCVFCLYIFSTCLIQRKFKDILTLSFWFSLGALLVTIPVIVWLTKGGALRDFWNAYIVFNMDYANSFPDKASKRFASLLSFSSNILVLFSIATCIYVSFTKKMKDAIANIFLVCILLTLILISMSGRSYGHYAMIMAPIILFPLTTGIDRLLSSSPAISHLFYFYKGHEKTFVAAVFLLLLAVLIPTLSGLKKSNIDNKVTEVCNIIKQNTNKDDKISVYGNLNIIYLFSNRLPATKYSYQFPIINIDNNLYNDYWKSMNNKPPKAIILERDKRDDKDMLAFLDKYNYKKIYDKPDSHLVYLR